MDNGTQLLIKERPKRVLRLKFPFLSTVEDISSFFAALEEELKQRRRFLDTVVFDLREIDTVLNSAGRILDLAVHFKNIKANSNIRFEMHIPRDVYKDLWHVTPDKLPAKPQCPDPRGGIGFRLSNKSKSHSHLEAKKDTEKVLLRCKGKIRAVEGRKVMVSLFVDEDEFTAETFAEQFPSTHPQVGQVFEYVVKVRRPGVTEVTMDFVPVADVRPDEVLDIWNSIDKRLPR